MKRFLQGTWLGHPLHSFLVHVPVALWPAAFVFDVLSTASSGSRVMVHLSFFALSLGLLVAVLAIPTGLADWLDITRKNPAWRIGLIHLALNLIILVLTVMNVGVRINSLDTATTVGGAELLLSLLVTVLLFISAYLGGRMVYHYGVNVPGESHRTDSKIARGARVPTD